MAFRVALTFDAEHPDRPHRPGGAEAVLRALADQQVTATVFLQGRWVESDPALARRFAAAGLQIGSHSHYHAHMVHFSPSGFQADVEKAEKVIRGKLGIDPRPWFRFPFGTAADDARRVALLRELGYRHVGWHVEVKEWQVRATVRGVADAIVDGARAHGDGAIVLLHTWPRPVAQALALAIPRLADAGASFVRVDQLDLPAGLGPIAFPRPEAVAGA
jgi:peptidoglycan/xylan/chitin deacetylase (PgdA/CDA1 family)